MTFTPIEEFDPEEEEGEDDDIIFPLTPEGPDAEPEGLGAAHDMAVMGWAVTGGAPGEESGRRVQSARDDQAEARPSPALLPPERTARRKAEGEMCPGPFGSAIA